MQALYLSFRIELVSFSFLEIKLEPIFFEPAKDSYNFIPIKDLINDKENWLENGIDIFNFFVFLGK